jgi:membrane protease YdiL (CAAX protease family)
MDKTNIFLLPDGRIRAAWRLVMFIVLYLLTRAVLDWAVPRVRGNFSLFSVRGVMLRTLSTVLISTAMLRLLEGRRFRDIGLHAAAGWVRAIGAGLASGSGLILLLTAILTVTAGVRFEFAGEPAAAAARISFLQWTPLLLLAASSEELLFRGYPFQLAVAAAGRFVPIAGLSLLFGIMHLSNPAADLPSTANTILAGVWLSIAYLRARSLWYPIAAHFTWNWTMAAVGFPVSGFSFPSLGWATTSPVDTAWLHGGAYGPEGGAACTVLLGVTCVILWWRPHWLGCHELAEPPQAPQAE